MTKKLCTKNLDPRCLEAFNASRVIPLDKNPGVRPIGVGEVLRRIVGKSISWVLKEDIQEAAGTLQTCAGYKGGAEAAIHAMRAIFHSEDTEGVILIDARIRKHTDKNQTDDLPHPFVVLTPKM